MNHKFFNVLCAIALCILLCMGCKREIFKIDEQSALTLSTKALMSSTNFTALDSTIGTRVQYFNEKKSADAEQNRLELIFNAWNPCEATGFYLPPNTTMGIYVKQVAGDGLPRVVIGTYSQYLAPHEVAPKEIQLKEGPNTINVDGMGGLVWIKYVSTEVNPGGRVKLTFSGNYNQVPVYIKGQTTQTEWDNQLATFTGSRDVVLVGDRVYQVYSRTKAIGMQPQNNDYILNTVDQEINAEDDYSGCKNVAGAPLQKPNIHKILLVESNYSANPAVTNDYSIAVSSSNTPAFNGAFTEKVGTIDGWGIRHEIGHAHQQSAWTWLTDGVGVKEANVGLYGFAAERAIGITPSKLNRDNRWDQVFAYLDRPAADKDYNNMTNVDHRQETWVKTAMFYQLELAFKEYFYKTLQQIIRQEKPNNDTNRKKMDYFMLKACKISGRDLRNFFKDWGLLKNSDTVFSQMGALNLPLPDVAPSSLRD